MDTKLRAGVLVTVGVAALSLAGCGGAQSRKPVSVDSSQVADTARVSPVASDTATSHQAAPDQGKPGTPPSDSGAVPDRHRPGESARTATPRPAPARSVATDSGAVPIRKRPER